MGHRTHRPDARARRRRLRLSGRRFLPAIQPLEQRQLLATVQFDPMGAQGADPATVLDLWNFSYDQGDVLEQGLIPSSASGITVGTTFQFLYQTVVGGIAGNGSNSTAQPTVGTNDGDIELEYSDSSAIQDTHKGYCEGYWGQTWAIGHYFHEASFKGVDWAGCVV
jgi:hypothetical protein